MKNTFRIQNNHIMTDNEKSDFVEIIRKMPWLYTLIIEKLTPYSGMAYSLLDVACGDGYLLELINAKFPNLDLNGIDIDPYFINKAKQKYAFRLEVMDALKLTDEYDIVTCNLALHHFDEPVLLIRKLINSANKVLIISDQVRPNTEAELIKRLGKRKEYIGDKEKPFYLENEKSSILEAYSKEEIEKIIMQIGMESKIKVNIEFFDTDYYERFVATLEK